MSSSIGDFRHEHPPLRPARCLAVAAVNLDMLGTGEHHQVVERVGIAAVFEPNAMMDFKPARFAGQFGAVSRPPKGSTSSRRP